MPDCALAAYGECRRHVSAVLLGSWLSAQRSARDTETLVELDRWSLKLEHLERKAAVQILQTRVLPKTVPKLAHHVLSDLSVPVHELPPQGHVSKSMLDHVRGHQV